MRAIPAHGLVEVERWCCLRVADRECLCLGLSPWGRAPRLTASTAVYGVARRSVAKMGLVTSCSIG